MRKPRPTTANGPSPLSIVQNLKTMWTSRSRVRYLAFAVGTIAVGLMVHLGGTGLPPVFRDVLGDALWAMMIVWWLSAAAPRLRLRTRGVMALAVCVAVEVSQRYHTPLLDALRRTLPGHLVLGSGYDPRDLLAYAAGVIAAVVLDRLIEE
jgi:hypothetical protein